MMNQAKSIGALANISNETDGIVQASRTFEDMGYPSNLPDDDKAYIIKRLMDFANEDFNPWASGSTGLPLLLKEKYGVVGSK
jgi:hypothetical protein